MASASCLSTVGGSGNNARWIPLDIKIMIIDEDPTCLSFLAKLLETCHFKVESFQNPVDALHALYERKEEYDLVIMDLECINMPGFDLLETIVRKTNIPVTTTCYDKSEKNRNQALFSGACCHIVKPVTVNNLEFVWMKEWRCSVKRKESKKQGNGKGTADCKSNAMSADDLDSNKNSKTRLHWDEKLHERFLIAVSLLGVDANSKSIMGIMNVEGLTGKEVSSHLQKHRMRLQKEKESNFSPPILPLHQFPTSMKLSFSMPNGESTPIVIEDKEEWTIDELLCISEATEVSQHDHQMINPLNDLFANFDYLFEFLDFDFESNNNVAKSEEVQHDRQMIHSLKGSNVDFDTEQLNFTSERNKSMDEGEPAQHDQQILESSNGFDIDIDIDIDIDVDIEGNHFMDESEVVLLGINEAREVVQHDEVVQLDEVVQHDSQLVASTNIMDINSEFLGFNFERNNFMVESEAIRHDQRTVNSPNGLVVNQVNFPLEILDFNFESNNFNLERTNLVGEFEAEQQHHQNFHSLNDSATDFDFDPELLNYNLETDKVIDESSEAVQHDQQMIDSSNDFDFESNHFMDESKVASQGKDDSPNDFDFVPEFLEFDFEKATFLDDI